MFKHDLEYEANEEKYQAVRKEILGDGSDDSESGEGGSGDDSSEEESDNEDEDKGNPVCFAIAIGVDFTDLSSLNKQKLRRQP